MSSLLGSSPALDLTNLYTYSDAVCVDIGKSDVVTPELVRGSIDIVYQDLTDSDLLGQNFRNLDYYFIPLYYNREHWSLAI